jgi:tetrahydromethanopterin S-methyltransferase subunit B
MSNIRAVPEFHLVLNPMTGILAEEREDVVQFSLDPIRTQIEELDKIVTDMMNQLAPTSPLLSMYPGRERASYNAGIFTNIFYGFVIGMILAFVILFVIAMRG